MSTAESEVDRHAAVRHRIELTVSCNDCAHLPKVPGAGAISDGVQMMHNGVRVIAGGYFGTWMSEIIERLAGHHEPQEELVVHHIVERLAIDVPSPVVIELGAFWAYYSLWALHRMPEGRAILVEPDPGNLEVGRRNFELNDRSGTFINAAVGAGRLPPIEFLCESDNAMRSVPVVGLDSIMADTTIDHVDFLLLDVQGAETDFLEGAFETLRSGAVRFAVVSTHHHLISGDALTHERCLDLLRRAGGHVVAEHPVYESYSGDGLIAVAFHERDRDFVVDVSRARARDSLFGDPMHDVARERAGRIAAESALAAMS
jgi:FkbM family methyltransferase